ncbi:MAG: glycosyltransferase family 39 protein [Kiritimatiellae bacterium]|nr:glycosyltransferase family 39 protein [Kiritimatiellia bacterium]
MFTGLLALWGGIGEPTVTWAMRLMLILAAVTTIAVGLAGRSYGGESVGLFAALLYGLHPLAVANDPYALPDSLAVMLLSISLLAYTHSEGGKRWKSLAVSGVVTGASIGAKAYYVLLAPAFAVAIILDSQLTRTEKVRRSANLTLSTIAGLLIAFAAGETLSGLSPGAWLSSYPKRLIELIGEAPSGSVATVQVLLGRLSYLVTLFVQGAGLIGWLFLAGIVYGLAQWRRCFDSRFLALSVIGFLLFLMFMPVRLSPLLLVEMQYRYLTVVLPMLALLGARFAVNSWTALHGGGLRLAVAVVFAAGMAWAFLLPASKSMMECYGKLEGQGIVKATHHCKAIGVEMMLLPASANWETQLPPELLANGVEVQVTQAEEHSDAASALHWVKAGSGTRAVYIPRDSLCDQRGTRDARCLSGKDAVLALTGAGAHSTDIRIPRNGVSACLIRACLGKPKHLTGWLVVID